MGSPDAYLASALVHLGYPGRSEEAVGVAQRVAAAAPPGLPSRREEVDLLKWLEHHPLQGDKEVFLFCAGDEPRRPTTPYVVNKRLRATCKHLGIEKRVSSPPDAGSSPRVA